MGDFSRSFTGIALEMTPGANPANHRPHNTHPFGHLSHHLSGAWPALAQILVLTCAVQVVVFALPFQLQAITDTVLPRANTELLQLVVCSFAALVVIHAFFELLRSVVVQLVGQRIASGMTTHIVGHLFRLPAEFFQKRHVGDVTSRVSSASKIQELLTQGAVVAIIDGLSAVVALVLMASYSLSMTLVVLLFSMASVALAAAVMPKLLEHQDAELHARAEEQSNLMETIRAATVVKLMGTEAIREGIWSGLYARVVNANNASSLLNDALSSAQTLLGGLQVIAIVYLSAAMVMEGSGFTLGMMLAYLAFAQTFRARVSSTITEATRARSIMLHLNRLSDILEQESDGFGQPDSLPTFVPAAGKIELQDVSYRYGAHDRDVVIDVSVKIRAGEFVAITGPSGGGKSTLFRLMSGLLKPTSGQVKIEGRDGSAAMFRQWRKSVGVVMQDDQLFSGSIAENIAFFDPAMDLDRVRHAASEASIHDEIEALPMKYLSLVGDMGSALSGGQKQRVLLARALYRNPSVLFMDEGTANLDVAAEESIALLVSKMVITRIVIAHRPALIRRADRVLRMDGGRLTAVRGSAESTASMVV